MPDGLIILSISHTHSPSQGDKLEVSLLQDSLKNKEKENLLAV